MAHRSWVQEYVKLRLNLAGRFERRQGFYVKCPTYKDGYGQGIEGFETEKGHGPRPVGAYWLRFYTYSDQGDMKIGMQVIKAD